MTKISVNEEIQDRTIRHQVYLERYKASEIKRILKILNFEIIPEITDKIETQLNRILERGSDVGKTTLKRLQELEKVLKELADNMSDGLQKQIVVDLSDLTKNELEWQLKTIQQSLSYNLETVMPNPRAVVNIIKATSFAGLTMGQWFETLSNSTQRNVMAAVNRGIVEGETTAQIMQRIRGTRKLKYTDGVMQTTRRQAEAITRTTINHATNQARLEFFKENEDIIKGLKWVATLDSRTSTICAGLDGKVFPVDKGPRPPAHPNCRSTMTAVLADADELGIDELPQGKRASIDGQVPASTTYGEWLKRQPIAVQEQVLGVSKAKLFRDGKLPIERFTDNNQNPLTLEQLRVLEKSAFEKAGI